MIKTKRLKAFNLEKRLFDQSIVGIFPKNPKLKTYILAFLNTKICSDFIQAINHTANNSANYIKKIPFVVTDDSLREVNEIMQELNGLDSQEIIEKLDDVFKRLFL